tara:strand:+ start:186 stop:851 length:666 start_codon:yes stop_codon:yes gene_type:complete
MDIIIRDYRKGDDVETVIRACFPTLSEEELFLSFNDPNSKIIVAEVDKKVVGYGIYSMICDNSKSKLESLISLKNLDFQNPNESLIKKLVKNIELDFWKSNYEINIYKYCPNLGIQKFEQIYKKKGDLKTKIFLAQNNFSVDTNNMGHLEDLGVLPQYQGKGIAMKLILERIEKLKGKSMFVEAFQGSPTNHIYSNKLGFSQVAYVEPMFDDNSGSLFMVK